MPLIKVNERSIEAEHATTLFHTLQKANVPIATACFAKGNCHLCKVRVLKNAEQLTSPSVLEIKALGNAGIQYGLRLACQIRVVEGLEVQVMRAA